MSNNLECYQGQDRYLFHGSSSGNIKVLQPSQATSFGLADGEPTVHASTDEGPAIYMAVVGSKKLGGWGMKGKPGFGFYILDSDLERARNEAWFGYVYILEKAGFTKKSDWEWVSYAAVKPIEAVLVGVKDLPEEITVLT